VGPGAQWVPSLCRWGYRPVALVELTTLIPGARMGGNPKRWSLPAELVERLWGMTVFATLANQSGGNVRPSPGEAASFNSPGPPAYLERPRAPRRLPGVQAKTTPHDQEKKAPPSSDRDENAEKSK